MIQLKDKDGKSLTSSQTISKILKRIQSYFLDFWLMVLIFTGYIPSHSIRNLFYKISGIKIGKKSYIHYGARFYLPKNIIIGRGTIIGDHAFIDGREKVLIGNNVDIASEVRIYNSEHDINSMNFTAINAPVEVGDYVFIGPRVTILPGVKIGQGAVIAAGSVVVKDVEPRTLVGGIPAKYIKDRELKEYTYRLGRPKLFQ